MNKLFALFFVVLGTFAMQTVGVEAITLTPNSGGLNANTSSQIDIVAQPPSTINANSVTLRLSVTNATVTAVELNSSLLVKIAECAGNVLYTAKTICMTLGKNTAFTSGEKLGTITLDLGSATTKITAEDGSFYKGTASSGSSSTAAISGELASYTATLVATNSLVSAPVSTPTGNTTSTTTTKTTSNSDMGLLIAALGVVVLGIFFALFLLIRNALRSRASNSAANPTTTGKLLTETVATTTFAGNPTMSELSTANSSQPSVTTTTTVSTNQFDPKTIQPVEVMPKPTEQPITTTSTVSSTVTNAPAEVVVPVTPIQPVSPAVTPTVSTVASIETAPVTTNLGGYGDLPPLPDLPASPGQVKP